MQEFNFISKTPSKDIQIKCKIVAANVADLLEFVKKERNDELCKTGCPNFNKKWSCPPLSPSFTNYSKKYKYVLLALFYCDLSQFNYIKNEYLKIKASNMILKTKMDKFLRGLEESFDGKLISNGSCKLCKPCARKVGKTCNKPQKMRFSMEALGLDVEAISKEYFNHELLWYKDKQIPNYSSVVSGLLTSDDKIFKYETNL